MSSGVCSDGGGTSLVAGTGSGRRRMWDRKRSAFSPRSLIAHKCRYRSMRVTFRRERNDWHPGRMSDRVRADLRREAERVFDAWFEPLWEQRHLEIEVY